MIRKKIQRKSVQDNQRFFYPEELVLVGRERLAPDKRFKVERVIRTEGRGAKKRALVKWFGYPDKFNSWVKVSELEDI